MPRLGLIGYPLSHSFSPAYFRKKFAELGISDWSYELFPLASIDELRLLLGQNIHGLNVTIPYKTAVLPFCNALSEEAGATGAVNCLEIENRDNNLFITGHNTDVLGFRESLLKWYQPQLRNALIIGNGGSAKAVAYVLKNENIPFVNVVRNPTALQHIIFSELSEMSLQPYDLIVNCTPVGMWPHHETILPFSTNTISSHHHYYDLIYNPEVTTTMKMFARHGAQVKNGLEMLHLQADKAWHIWSRK